LDPHNPEIDIRTSEVLLIQGRVEAALSTLEAWTARLTGHLPTYWGALATTRLVHGDDRGAEGALDHALAMDPFECRVLIARGIVERSRTGTLSNPVASGLRFNCSAGDSLYLEDLVDRFDL
jgi:hypothetical protein